MILKSQNQKLKTDSDIERTLSDVKRAPGKTRAPCFKFIQVLFIT